MPVRSRLGLGVLCLAAASAGSLGGASAQVESFTTVLAPGFNLVG